MSLHWWESIDSGQVYGRTLDRARGYEVDDRALNLAGVPRRYRECSLDKIPESVPHHRPLYLYARNIVQNIDKGQGILLFGDFGTGKTGASVSILAEALHVGAYCLFVTALDLNEIFKARGDEARSFRNKVEKIQFLVMDDVGAARERDFGLHKEILERIIRVRYNSMLPTIITTNQEYKPFLEENKSVSSILGADYMPVRCSGINWRRGGASCPA